MAILLNIAYLEIIGKTVFVVIFAIYLWFCYKFSYWARKSVAGPKPVFPFGNVKSVIKRKAQFFQPFCDNYFKYKNLPYVGMYFLHCPVLCVNDPEIAKLILIKDFEYFQSHGILTESEGNTDPLAHHLFNIYGDRWKNLRFKMSPTFSPGKLKSMYPLVHQVADVALQHLEGFNLNGQAVNFSEFYSTYTMEIIASVGFGLECNGFKNPNTEFHIRGREYFETKSLYWTINRAMIFIAPDLFKQLKLKRFSRDMVDFFYGLVRETTEYRLKNLYRRNDFLQSMIDLMNGQTADETGELKKVERFPFTLHDLAANTLLYLAAGFETSATVGEFTAYELALNPDIQKKAREEVVSVLARHNGECTYEAQNEMTYLNMIFDETMRKYPPMRALFRRCNKDYRLPNSDLTIDKGTLVFVPCQAIHMDPEIHSNPHKFDPERFSPENKSKRHPCHWMPFGEGPRKCLGLRQGYVQVKVAMAKLLEKYELILDERTQVPLKAKPSSMSFVAEGGVWIKLKKISVDK